MKVLTSGEIAEWFEIFKTLGELNDYVQCDDRGLFYSHPEATCIDLEYPQKLEQLSFFGHYVATIGYEEKDFQGALIWFTEWGVWNEFDEGVGYRIIERMNIAAGQPKSFEVAPGHRFRADELPDAIGMLLQPMIFGWDCYYFPRWSYGTGEFFLHVSHDSFVTVVTRTRTFYDQIFKQLEALNLNPKPGHEMRTNRFCRRP